MRPRSLLEPDYLTRDESAALARRVLALASADQTRVTITSTARGNTRWAVNQISTAGDDADTTVAIRSTFGARSATATTNRLDDASLRAALATSEQLARVAPEDPEAMPELPPQRYDESRGWSAATAALDPAGRAAAVARITEPARAQRLAAAGYLESIAGSTAVANSNGLFAYGRETAVSLTTTVRTPDGSGSGWAGAAHSDWSRVDAESLGARAIEKARRSAEPLSIEPGRYTVVLEPAAVASLVLLIASALGARDADEGRTFFTRPGGGTKVGLAVIDSRISLWSDPLDPDAYALTFAGDGLPLRRTTWIENGVVAQLAYDRYWAQRRHREPSPLAGTLHMSGDAATLEDLIQSTTRGILVTRFWYIRPIDARTMMHTGLTRDGTFLIENGRITRSISNLRFTASPVLMLNNVEGMGCPVRVSASDDGSPGFAIVVPPLAARDFTFTASSDAV